MYTEAMLKVLKKGDLVQIATDAGIELPEGATVPVITAMILEKGVPAPEVEPEEVDGFPKHPKDYFMASHWYAHKRDMLDKLLDDEKEYSFPMVEKMLNR